MKIKPSRSGEITLSFTDVGESCPSPEFLMWQICLLTCADPEGVQGVRTISEKSQKYRVS